MPLKIWRSPPRTELSKSYSTKAPLSLARSPRINGALTASSTVRTLRLAAIPGQILIDHAPHLVLEHGSAKHRQMALDHLVAGLLEFATNEQGSKSVTKALKEGGKETLDRFVKRMAESTKGYSFAFWPNRALTRQVHRGRRAIIVDLALSVTGSQIIASVLPNVCYRLLRMDWNPYQNFLRSTRISAHFCMSPSAGISSLSVVARRVQRLFGYCE